MCKERTEGAQWAAGVVERTGGNGKVYGGGTRNDDLEKRTGQPKCVESFRTREAFFFSETEATHAWSCVKFRLFTIYSFAQRE